MIRLERTRQEPHGLGEIKALTSEMYVFLASEPFGRWPTGRNRLVCVTTRVPVELLRPERRQNPKCLLL